MEIIRHGSAGVYVLLGEPSWHLELDTEKDKIWRLKSYGGLIADDTHGFSDVMYCKSANEPYSESLEISIEEILKRHCKRYDYTPLDWYDGSIIRAWVWFGFYQRVNEKLENVSQVAFDIIKTLSGWKAVKKDGDKCDLAFSRIEELVERFTSYKLLEKEAM